MIRLLLEGPSRERCEQVASLFLCLMLRLQYDMSCVLSNDYCQAALPKDLYNSPRCKSLIQKLDFYDYEHRVRTMTAPNLLLLVNYYKIPDSYYQFRTPKPDFVFYLQDPTNERDREIFYDFTVRNELHYAVINEQSNEDDDVLIYRMLSLIVHLLPEQTGYDTRSSPMLLNEDEEASV